MIGLARTCRRAESREVPHRVWKATQSTQDILRIWEKTSQKVTLFNSDYACYVFSIKLSFKLTKSIFRCKDLNETILQNAARVKAAIKLTQEDSQTIAILRKEVDKAWKLVEQAKNNEEKARKIISDLKSEISHLSKIVDKGSGLNVGEDNSVTKMMAEKASLENELAQKTDFIAQLENQKLQFQERLVKIENDMLREKEEIERLKQDNEKLRDEKQRE